MKKYLALLAGAVALAAVPASAGLLNSGLPTWSFTDTTYGYPSGVTFEGNPNSAMCVGCHSVNPSQFIGTNMITVNAGSDYTAANLTTMLGTHFVMNVLATGDAAAIGTTALNGGADGGNGMYDQSADSAKTAKYENQGTWATTIPAAGTIYSKYAGADWANTTTTDGTPGDMICESCHSLYRNVTRTDGALLVGAYEDNGDSAICTGCHGDMHSNGNLPAFAGTDTRKRHHVLSGDTLASANYAAGNMWAPALSDKVATGWCGAGAYSTQTPTLIADDDITFRGACNVAGQGTVLVGGTTGDIVGVEATGLADITCANCHRPHNAMSGAGAYILRSGDATFAAAADFGGPTGTNTTAGTIGYGIRRQEDVGSYTSAKIYKEYIPLCQGCHQGYN